MLIFKFSKLVFDEISLRLKLYKLYPSIKFILSMK